MYAFLKKYFPLFLAGFLILASVGYWQFAPRKAFADSIAFDAASGATTGTTNHQTQNHTIGAGTNMILFVGILTTNNDLLTYTYNGTTMTQVAQFQGNFDSRFLTIFCQTNPTAGTHAIDATSGSSETFQLFAVSYSGAKQTCTADNSTNGTSATSPFDLTLTTVADNCWTLIFVRNQVGVIAGGTGTVSRVQTNSTGLMDSNGAKTPPGSTTLEVTSTSGFYGLMISFAPAVAAVVVNPPMVQLLNVQAIIKNSQVTITGK